MTTTTSKVTVALGLLALTGVAITPLFAQDARPDRPPMHRMGPGGPGGPGFGRGPGGPGGPGGPMGLLGELGRGLRQLDITDAQREQLRGVMQAREAAFKAIGERMRAAHEGLEAAISADVVDEAAIRTRSADVAAVQADAAVLRAQVRQEAFSVLTAEQQAKAKELRAAADARRKAAAERRQERRGERRERRQPQV